MKDLILINAKKLGIDYGRIHPCKEGGVIGSLKHSGYIVKDDWFRTIRGAKNTICRYYLRKGKIKPIWVEDR